MPAAELVKEGDVLMKVDGHLLADDGTVEAMHGLRLPWDFLISRRPCGHQALAALCRQLSSAVVSGCVQDLSERSTGSTPQYR